MCASPPQSPTGLVFPPLCHSHAWQSRHVAARPRLPALCLAALALGAPIPSPASTLASAMPKRFAWLSQSGARPPLHPVALPLCRMTATPLRRSVASYCVWLLPRFVALALGSSGAGRSSALDLFYLHISLPFSGPRCLIIVPLFLLDLVTSCLPLLGGYGALTRGVYQHLTLNGKLKTKTIFY
jgi:hypothetical protein